MMMNKVNIKYGGRSDFSGRVNFVLALYCIMAVIIFGRLVQIQIFKYDFYKAMAQDQHEFLEKTFPKRGEIFIRDVSSKKTYPIAVNREMNLVYAVPRTVQNKSEAAKKISEILKLEEGKVYGLLNKPNDPYEVIAHKVDDADVERIRKEKIKGIEITPEIVRYYPSKDLAANVVGFMGYKDDKKVGQYGIEGYFNASLEGSMGFLEIEKDVSGSWISIGSKSGTLPRDGDDIVLTIDQTIQYVAEKKLKEAVERWEAESGNVIIIDPKTGDVIAMAQYPSFDPNEYYKEKNLEIFLNSNIHNVYEPGSIEKTITMAIGIESGKITQNTTYVDSGAVLVDGWTIKNSDGKAHGTQSMIGVLENSLNTGTIFVEQQVGKDDFYRYLKNFELDGLTGIELNGEARGNLENLKVKNDVNYATASFGQGISVTPLSILMAISSLANDGKLMRPNIVSEVIHPDGKTEKIEPKYVRKTVSAKTANIISAMMVSVVENGHAKGAKVKGYKIAGKTGTAQIPKKEGKGYEEVETIHTFVGFGPVPNPKFSILVKLDKPKANFAESTAVPVFKELAEELINYYNISPTEKLD
ncbi:MAG: penicillin-binding protein 2 [Candidatus Paceibacterota bacterium]